MLKKEQNPICLGIQFLFDPNTGSIKKNENNEICAYKITTSGKYFIGLCSLVDPLWKNCFNLLCENTLSSVTFYSESYTKAMMPDRIAGNLSDLMIAYARVYKEINPTDVLEIDINDEISWKKRINYTPSNLDHIPLNSGESIYYKSVIVYPFIFNTFTPIPDFFKSLGINSLYFNNAYSIVERNAFPNIQLKANLEDNISSNNKDHFNILL